MSFVYSKKRILGGKRKIRSRRNGGSGRGMPTGLKDHRGNMIYVPIKSDGEYAIEGDVGDSSLPDVAQLRVDGAKTPTMEEITQASSENSTLNFIPKKGGSKPDKVPLGLNKNNELYASKNSDGTYKTEEEGGQSSLSSFVEVRGEGPVPTMDDINKSNTENPLNNPYYKKGGRRKTKKRKTLKKKRKQTKKRKSLKKKRKTKK
jgi:hypothetical protein